MVLSMTGFGRGTATDDNREVTIEMKAINHRYLDINLRMPRVLSSMEDAFRKKIQQTLSRGRIEVYIGYKNKAQDQITVTVNQSVANAYHDAFQNLSNKFGLGTKPDLATLASMDGIFTISEAEEDETVLKELLFSALENALTVMIQMREKEGAFLAQDVRERCHLIGTLVDSIEGLAPAVVEEYRKKLEMRLKDLVISTDLAEQRFLTEVVFFADRSNITEEIIRLRSHLNQMKQTMKNGGAMGRKLDFIVQEMNREANTIGSKSTDATITGYVVEIKSEIEKIREQIQNIE